MHGDVFTPAILTARNGSGYIHGIYIPENVVRNTVDFVVNICDLPARKALSKHEFCNVWQSNTKKTLFGDQTFS